MHEEKVRQQIVMLFLSLGYVRESVGINIMFKLYYRRRDIPSIFYDGVLKETLSEKLISFIMLH